MIYWATYKSQITVAERGESCVRKDFRLVVLESGKVNGVEMPRIHEVMPRVIQTCPKMLQFGFNKGIYSKNIRTNESK